MEGGEEREISDDGSSGTEGSEDEDSTEGSEDEDFANPLSNSPNPLSNSSMDGREVGVRTMRQFFSVPDDYVGVQCPKKQRTSEEQQNQGNDQLVDEREAEEKASDRSIIATLTDPEVLDCPICFEHLCLPVFQCQNGHLACSSCCSKLGNKCPSCSSRVGFYRCRGVEKILESVKIPCQNMKYGCKEMVFCCKRCDHQDNCLCDPCSCPLPDCDFVGSSKNLSLHFSEKHSKSAKRFCFNKLIPISLDKQQKYFILQEQVEGSLFILNNWVEPYGNTINVSCIGRSSTDTKIFYDLLVKNGDSFVKLRSFTKFFPAWVEHAPLERFLVVPNDFVGYCGKLKLQLFIWSELSKALEDN